MKLSCRVPVPALAAALLLSGLLAVLPACSLWDCGPAMVVDEHDRCALATAEVTMTCCQQSFEAPATPTRLAERPALAGPATIAVVAAAIPAATPAANLRVAAAGPPLPLDSLAQNRILRI